MQFFNNSGFGCFSESNVSGLLRSHCGDVGGGSETLIVETFAQHRSDSYKESDVASTLAARDYKDATDIVCVDGRNFTESVELNGTLQAKKDGYNYNSNNVIRDSKRARRLTPLECSRLQGYPDDWCDIGEWTDTKGKSHKDVDAPKYKALGNSIALPFWQWLARRIVAQYEGDVTMGSLFDGLGGFPLVFQRAGAKPVWASEIEEFCIAVTKKHFGDSDGTI